MSRPPLNPDQTASGIAVDPRTLERVIPESKRPDGSVRKEIRIRPGFTPQEDVRRFRGTKQAQMDATALPKGHIIGWAPPPSSSSSSNVTGGGVKVLSKSAKKNAKRREKKDGNKEVVREDWEDEEGGDSETLVANKAKSGAEGANNSSTDRHTTTQANEAVASSDGEKGKLKDATIVNTNVDSANDRLTAALEKLEVR